MPARRSGIFILAAALFFVSGALGLGYELVWIQKSSLLVGASQIALATVLTSFFLGLGLGSLFVGRYLRSRRWSPLFVYGLFEAAIGIFALLFPALFGWTESIYGALYPLFEASAAGLFLIRFLLLFLLFLVPTFFMGGTLPLLLDGLVARDRLVGSLTSFLYGLNILGAVAGVLATSYFAIPQLGMNGTSRIAGLANLAIGAVALISFRRVEPLHAPTDLEPRFKLPAFFIAVSFVSGFAAIGYQVVWARYFSLFSAHTVHFTAVLLATYLLALAFGSLVLAPVLRARIHPLRVLAVLQPLVPVLVVLCLGAWQLVVLDFEVLDNFEVAARWYFFSEPVDVLFIGPLLAVGSVLFLPVALLGTGLPVIIAAATEKAGALRATAGALVFCNTLGSSAGGLAAGYALLPWLGLTDSFGALAALSIGLGAAAEWKLGRDRAAVGLLRPGYILPFAALLFVLFLGHDDITRTILLRPRGSERVELLAVREGPLTTAYVVDRADGRTLGAGSVRLATAFRNRLSPQAVQGYVPALFYPRPGWPESVLGIALGTGQTFGSLLHPPLKRLDVVDISSEITELSREYFDEFNNGLAHDPRVRFHLDDGRHYIARAAAGSYDVVSLEPPPPDDEGIYRLYSLEFYQGIDRILREKGVLAQWLPPYLVTPGDVRGMLKTQADVFPNTFVVRNGPRDFVIMSIKGDPPRYRLAWIEDRLDELRAERGMKDMRWTRDSPYLAASLEGVLSLLVTGPDDIARMQAPCLHREDDMRLSYSSGDRWMLPRYFDQGLMELSFAAVPVTPFANLQQYFDDPIPAAELEEERARGLAHLGVVSPTALAEAITAFEQESDAPARAHRAIAVAELHARRPDVPAMLAWLARAVEAHPADTNPADLAAARHLARAHGTLHGQEIHAWIDALPDAQRQSPLVRALDEELRQGNKRRAERQSRYLWE